MLVPCRAGITHVLRSIGRYGRVRGFVDDADVDREWIFVGIDGGLFYHHIFNLPEFERLIPVLGTGHENKNCTQLAMNLGFNLGIGALAGVMHQITTEKALTWLRSAGDNHVAYQFLMEELRVGAAEAVFLSWRQCEPLSEARDMTRMLAWFEDSRVSDTHFRNVTDFFIMEVLPSLSLLRLGQRVNGPSSSGDYAAYSGGRPTFLLLMWARHHSNYAKHLLYDLGLYGYILPDPVRFLRRTFFSIMGEGFDFRFEIDNKLAKRQMHGSRWIDFIEGAAFRDIGPVFRDILMTSIGLRDRSFRGRSSPAAIAESTRRSVEFFMGHRTFIPVAGRAEALTVDLRTQLRATIAELLEAGAKAVNEAVPSFIAYMMDGQTTVQVPRRVSMTNAEVAEDVAESRSGENDEENDE